MACQRIAVSGDCQSRLRHSSCPIGALVAPLLESTECRTRPVYAGNRLHWQELWIWLKPSWRAA